VDALAYRAEGFSWASLEERLRVAGGRGAIVGPEGHGKTTLLTQWAARRESLGDRVVFLRVASGQRRLTDTQRRLPAQGAWIFLDSAEQLGWLGWRELRRLTSGAATLVVTTHLPGRLPTVYSCRTSAELLSELAGELHGAHPDCDALWQRHRGNVRLALRELYDRCSLNSETAGCV
jgi:hypothetical protein